MDQTFIIFFFIFFICVNHSSPNISVRLSSLSNLRLNKVLSLRYNDETKDAQKPFWFVINVTSCNNIASRVHVTLNTHRDNFVPSIHLTCLFLDCWGKPCVGRTWKLCTEHTQLGQWRPCRPTHKVRSHLLMGSFVPKFTIFCMFLDCCSFSSQSDCRFRTLLKSPTVVACTHRA